MLTLNNYLLLKANVLVSCSVLIYSCLVNAGQQRNFRDFSKLTVIVDDSSNFYIDKVLIKNDSNERVMPYVNDSSITNFNTYGYDSLKNGKYEITINSLLNSTVKLPVSLEFDSVLYVGKSLLQNFEIVNDALPLVSELKDGDSVIVTYTSLGCFHHAIEMGTIYKYDSGYNIKFTADTSKNYEVQQLVTIKRSLPASFADTLKRLAEVCTNAFRKQQKILASYKEALTKAKNTKDSVRANCSIPYSTTSSAIYLRNGNRVFSLTSEVILDIPYYYHFLEAMKVFD